MAQFSSPTNPLQMGSFRSQTTQAHNSLQLKAMQQCQSCSQDAKTSKTLLRDRPAFSTASLPTGCMQLINFRRLLGAPLKAVGSRKACKEKQIYSKRPRQEHLARAASKHPCHTFCRPLQEFKQLLSKSWPRQDRLESWLKRQLQEIYRSSQSQEDPTNWNC